LVALNLDFGLDYQSPYEEDDITYEYREEIVIEGKNQRIYVRKPTKDKIEEMIEK
jgi:hypothetical protein